MTMIFNFTLYCQPLWCLTEALNTQNSLFVLFLKADRSAFIISSFTYNYRFLNSACSITEQFYIHLPIIYLIFKEPKPNFACTYIKFLSAFPQCKSISSLFGCGFRWATVHRVCFFNRRLEEEHCHPRWQFTRPPSSRSLFRVDYASGCCFCI